MSTEATKAPHPVTSDMARGQCPFPTRPDVAFQRKRVPLVRFGLAGAVHGVSAAVAIVLIWSEFALLLWDGFSLSRCVEHRRSAGTFKMAWAWTIAAAVAILSTKGMPYQNWVFSAGRGGDDGKEHRNFNWGRAFAALEYLWLVARTVLLPAWEWLRVVDLLVLALLFFPLSTVARIYPHSLVAYFEWMHIIQIAFQGSDSVLLSNDENACFTYNQSVMWCMMIFDGFFSYTLYAKGLASMPTVRAKMVKASTSDVMAFCIMFWRAYFSGITVAPVNMVQVVGRHVNLGMYPFRLYKSQSWAQLLHCIFWFAWCVGTKQSWESHFWIGGTLLNYLYVAHGIRGKKVTKSTDSSSAEVDELPTVKATAVKGLQNRCRFAGA